MISCVTLCICAPGHKSGGPHCEARGALSFVIVVVVFVVVVVLLLLATFAAPMCCCTLSLSRVGLYRRGFGGARFVYICICARERASFCVRSREQRADAAMLLLLLRFGYILYIIRRCENICRRYYVGPILHSEISSERSARLILLERKI